MSERPFCLLSFFPSIVQIPSLSPGESCTELKHPTVQKLRCSLLVMTSAQSDQCSRKDSSCHQACLKSHWFEGWKVINLFTGSLGFSLSLSSLTQRGKNKWYFFGADSNSSLTICNRTVFFSLLFVQTKKWTRMRSVMESVCWLHLHSFRKAQTFLLLTYHLRSSDEWNLETIPLLSWVLWSSSLVRV